MVELGGSWKLGVACCRKETELELKHINIKENVHISRVSSACNFYGWKKKGRRSSRFIFKIMKLIFS